MKKVIVCENCKGSGEVEINMCEDCGSCNHVGYDITDGKYRCQLCWLVKEKERDEKEQEYAKS